MSRLTQCGNITENKVYSKTKIFFFTFKMVLLDTVLYRQQCVIIDQLWFRNSFPRLIYLIAWLYFSVVTRNRENFGFKAKFTNTLFFCRPVAYDPPQLKYICVSFVALIRRFLLSVIIYTALSWFCYRCCVNKIILRNFARVNSLRPHKLIFSSHFIIFLDEILNKSQPNGIVTLAGIYDIIKDTFMP